MLIIRRRREFLVTTHSTNIKLVLDFATQILVPRFE